MKRRKQQKNGYFCGRSGSCHQLGGVSLSNFATNSNPEWNHGRCVRLPHFAKLQHKTLYIATQVWIRIVSPCKIELAVFAQEVLFIWKWMTGSQSHPTKILFKFQTASAGTYQLAVNEIRMHFFCSIFVWPDDQISQGKHVLINKRLRFTEVTDNQLAS